MLFTKKTWKSINETGATPVNKAALNDFETRIDETFKSIYPIGSIYISVNNTNPGTLFGGTWQSFAQGKTLVGVNDKETEFNTVLKTGGSKTVTLTAEQIPSHHHSVNGYWGESGGSEIGVGIKDNQNLVIKTTDSVGGGQAHNNLQPYITVYFWCRTA